MRRCEWCEKDELYRHYHDNEWGEANKSERELFELVCLESMQAGLSWHIVLKKREALRAAFLGFEPEVVAKFSKAEVSRIMGIEGVIKHEAKVRACITNAQCFLAVRAEFGSFWSYLLSFTPNNTPIINRYERISDLPSKSEISIALAKDMKKRGFKFFGEVIAHSFLQACGVLNEHLNYCYKA
ncbi:DNA-3-methyladenine glycosylase I [Campylobacter sp. 19-13652]|uniref:DNA-3-methyladenine glycosylase I n=1 Tax=Campylobacter sp. 19-13652 TaxID=2840180 RepID=UPI001C784EFA|nr:DNA-3-methyladenine glycosylase I [Campylobacter sp. 19-13652]BCX79786.1 DNA-3-methyladenine glycosylase I [Campylobacter sp. 19-13652]